MGSVISDLFLKVLVDWLPETSQITSISLRKVHLQQLSHSTFSTINAPNHMTWMTYHFHLSDWPTAISFILSLLLFRVPKSWGAHLVFQRNHSFPGSGLLLLAF